MLHMGAFISSRDEELTLYIGQNKGFYELANAGNPGGGASPNRQQPDQELQGEWNNDECERFTFDDSDRFEEDSLCSWSSEVESLCNNWRGWKRPIPSNSFIGGLNRRHPEDNVTSLTELAAKCVASFIPFELVEHVYPPVPEQLQLRIAFWSFPDNEEDIRLYSCLANSSADEFHRGDQLFKNRAVKDPLQIGFHLSASVVVPQPMSQQFNVAVTFDRRRISSCNCTCRSVAYWCSHVVAVCLHRIHCPNEVCLRAPVSESLTRLQRDQLQKFAQYLISELPQQILPTAQRLLDELLSAQPTAINTVCGAPDPTAGASANDQTNWYLDEKTLHDNIKKILIKFCLPAPLVFSDVNYLSNSAPPAAAEWSSLLRPLRGREPEGMWNLLSIVREMFRRCDRNAIRLLEIITEESLQCDQILIWWFHTKLSMMYGTGMGHVNGGKHGNTHSNTNASQHACSSLCDEIVVLWRLAALNPGLAPDERDMLHAQFTSWHLKILERVVKFRVQNTSYGNKYQQNSRSDADLFVGFKPAIEACYLDWEDYPLAGITHSQDANPMYHCPFACLKQADSKAESNGGQVNSSQIALNGTTTHYNFISSDPRHQVKRAFRERGYGSSSNNSNSSNDSVNVNMALNDIANDNGNRSSASSEGFCENEDDLPENNSSHMVEQSANNNTVSQIGKPSTVRAVSNETGAVASSNQALDHCEMNKSSSTLSLVSNSNVIESKTDEQSGTSSSNITEDLSDSSTQPNEMEKLLETSSSIVEPQPSTSGIQKQSKNNSVDYNNPEVRRISKDGSVSSSVGSQQSTDESDPNTPGPSRNIATTSKKCTEPTPNMSKVTIYSLHNHSKPGPSYESQPEKTIFNNLKPSDDAWDILFARAEGLHAHGHGREACILTVRLAEHLLANPPNLMIEVPYMPKRKGKHYKMHPISHQLSVLASATLAKCAFLCTVLADNSEHYHLAFRICLFGLEMPRPPASTKPLEVKLANQEADLLALLKRIPVGPMELRIIRERAEQLKDGTLKTRGDALLPIMLASYIFESLSMQPNSKDARPKYMNVARNLEDENLGFEAANAALGLKANVSEAEHPLLCEGTRRQRGDLALTLLSFYKDDSHKLARIMEKLLDREIHSLIKTPLLPSYYSSNPPIRTPNAANMRRNEIEVNNAYGGDFIQNDYPSVGGGSCNSRPQSSTSAEIDLGISLMNIGAHSQHHQIGSSTIQNVNTAIPSTSGMSSTPVITTTNRMKESRYKGKRAYPSIPNQPSEASAHFMFELAKNVLTKAGGTSSTSLFTQASTSQNHHGPHRALHMCAFQLGLYALGLHNCVSTNWLSRTYSSHVSWILGQAMEIGAPAISFLIDTWEGHLTPPEAAGMADRASRGWDNNMVYPAAELALSVLPHAAALNPSEIQRAILQCKEQSDVMLERACLTVENAAKGGGVYPEVLFQVGQHWFELFSRNAPDGEQEHNQDHDHMGHNDHNYGQMMEPQDYQHMSQTPQIQPQSSAAGQMGQQTNQQPQQQAIMVPSKPPQAQHFGQIQPIGLPGFGPYQFACPNYYHNVAYPHGNQMQMYISAPTSFQYPPQPGVPNSPGPQQPYQQQMGTPVYGNGILPMQPPNGQQPTAPYHQITGSNTNGPFVGNMPNQPPPTNGSIPTYYPANVSMSMPPSPSPGGTSMRSQPIIPGNHYGNNGYISTPPPPLQYAQPVVRQRHQYSQQQMKFLLNAYNVGMLAMEMIGRRIHDDRPAHKYSRNPPYGEDVKWLLRTSKRLGTHYLHQFCGSVVNSIISPFVLHDVVVEAVQYLGRNNPALSLQHLRTSLAPLLNKCQQMYVQCLHQKLYHLTVNDTEDFLSILVAARAAYYMTPEGVATFKDWLANIKKSKSCKKETWALMSAALQANTT